MTTDTTMETMLQPLLATLIPHPSLHLLPRLLTSMEHLKHHLYPTISLHLPHLHPYLYLCQYLLGQALLLFQQDLSPPTSLPHRGDLSPSLNTDLRHPSPSLNTSLSPGLLHQSTSPSPVLPHLYTSLSLSH